MEGTFSCFSCNKTFAEKDVLLKHIKIMHSLLQKFICRQDNCCRSFSTINDFRKHLNNNHTQMSIPNVKTTVNLENIATTSTESINSQPPNIDIKTKKSEIKEGNIDLHNEILAFISHLYSIPSMPRNIIQLIFNRVYELINSIFEYTNKLITSSNAGEDFAKEFKHMSNNLKDNTFATLRTEHLRLKYFENCQCYIKPLSFKIGERSSLQKVNTAYQPDLIFKKAEGQIVSLRSVFKLFLELPDVYATIIQYMEDETSVSSELLSSFIQGRLWKTIKARFEKDIVVLPVLMYFDDFECCNPLGSKAGIYKIGAVYVSLACIPTDFISLLENIFLAQLFYSSDRSCYGNKKTFNNIIKEFEFLEREGITITVNDKQTKVYFTMVALLGDNLGLNSLLGFQESFSSSFFCRICKTSKEISQTQTTENIASLRTQENYEDDSSSLSFGIKEICVFHDLPNFHVTKNISCDLMHDMLEGVLRYDMGHILNYFIHIKKYLTLSQLNKRLELHKFSEADIGSAIPQIKENHIKKKYIVMSASEMLAFVAYFGVIIGDLIPVEDECWELYVILHQILYILLSRVISRNTVLHLSYLIEQHHTLYLNLFEDTLKPKHHIIVHYPSFILNAGPPRYLWSMRYEAFHKILKNTAHAVTSRKNILLTLAIKQQLRFSFKIMSKKGFGGDITHGPSDELVTLSNHDVIIRLLALQVEKLLSTNFYVVPWVKMNGIVYKIGLVLQISDDEVPKFGIIKYITIMHNDNVVYFVLVPVFVIGFNSHIQCYEIDLNHVNNNNWILVKKSQLINKVPYNIHYTADGNHVLNIMQ